MKEMVGGCCVCSDDRGWSENPLVYCDGQSCAVAVHQACYGIVTVPSGPWYCRKCESQERSARVRCELCPSRDGALKRTDNQGWAHVVCALYIPEVRFGNVTTMEPIILQLIPQERYNKTCYICQEMGKGSRSTAGACMQCNKSGCKQQFHVTCAQQLGLLCEEAGNYLDNVKYCGYCQHHYSKLKKGGNVKTIPPYKPISHETNSSDGPSSPEKELEPASSGQQQHSSGSAMGGNSNSGSGNMKSNSRMPGGELGGSSSAAASSSSSSSKQRKSSSASKSSAGSSSTSGPTSGGMVSGGSNSLGANSQSTSSASSGMTGMGSGNAGSSTMPGSNNKTSASSSSGSTKDKDKYSKNVNKVSGTNKGHDKEPSSSSSSSSSSSQRDKSSKSSKSSGGTNSNPSGLGSSASNVNSVSSSLGNSLPKENDPLSSSLPSTMTSSSSNKHQDGIKQEKTLAQISSAAASSARAASLSPAAIPTTLIIKPPHDHSGSNKDLLSKEAIAKFTTSNFTETIVVNSDSVFGTTSSTTSNSNSNNAGGPTSQSSGIGSNMAPTSVIENTPGGGSGSGSKQLNMSGGGNSSYSGSGVAKKRKADARSTPTSIASGDIDINRDLIKDVAVSLVPLPLNKNDNIDPASLSGFEKSIKKAKTEPNSPLQPTTTSGDPNLQNVSPNLVQQTQHGSNVISSSSIKHQSQSNSPQLQQQQQQLQQQQQQQQNQPHTPSLVVSVPLSTATVPGINLPTSNSGSSGSSSTTTSSSNNATNSNSNVPPPTSSSQQSGSSNNSSSSGNTPNIISPGQMPPGSSLYQQIAHRSGSDQLLNAHTTNRSSPVIQQPAPSHVIQNAAHSILERHSPSMRSSPSIITSASSQQHQQPPPQSHNNLFLTAAMDLNSGSSLSGGVSVLQSISPVPPMSAIQSTSSSPITPGGDGGLKITFEKQAPTTNARITALQEQEQQLAGRRSRTPDNSFGSNSSFSGGGGLKFSYEAQIPTTTILSAAANPAQMGATSTIITAPQPMVVKESPPSSPGSDTGGVTAGARGGSNKRNRKLSTNSNAGKSSIAVGVGIVGDAVGGGAGPPLDAKDSKLFQNGVVHATHMLGNQLNPNSTVAQKMSDQLCMEVDAHSFVEAPTAMLGPPFPGKSQAARSSNATAPQPAPPSLSSMLSGSGTATANGNTPQSLEQLLERQWEQGSQFLMEQAQHFDIASLLSCLHQLRSENIRLEDHVNNLVARRDHLLAVNARLAIPLNPAALGGVGLGGGGGGSGGGGASGGTGGGPSGTAGGSGTGSAGSQGQFNNMHGNGPHDGGGSTTTTTSAISSRSSRIQQHQSQQQQQQQQTQSHFGSNSTGQLPLENGIDFRHSNTTHQNTNSSSIRHHSPSSQSYPNPSNSTGRQPPPTSLASSATAPSNVVGSMPPEQPPPSSHSRRGGGSSSSNAPSSNSTSSSSSSSAAAVSVYQSQQQTIYNTAHQIPLLLEHHQQEHHSQQPPPQQQQQQPPHHLRQTPPTVPSTSRSHGASRGGSNLGPSAHQLHLHHSHPSHHPASSSSSSAHAPHPPPQQPQHQQPLPQRQRH